MTVLSKMAVLKEQERESSSPFQPEPVSILVVDDLPEKLLAYEAILDELGQNVVTVQSGEEALKLVLRQEFAVILLDVNMPDMDGLETAMLIRKRKKSAHTPIIFLTAFTDEIRMAQGYASGAVDYLPTPVIPEILQAKVKVFIELAQMRRQAALQAQEHAKRTAAEETARGLEFLVDASETFARAQEQKDIMQSLIQLSVPYLADHSSIWVLEKETGQLQLYGMHADGEVVSDPAKLASVQSALERDIRQVLATGQPRSVNGFSEDSFFQGIQRIKGRSAVTVIVLPLVVKDHINAVVVLVSRNDFHHNAAATLSLASALISRADIALENAILLEKIKEADRRKDEFLAMLAHELRNPLAPIKSAIHILKMNSDKNVRDRLENTIERQTDHMVHLVDDLMDVSRITQNKIELRKETVKLQDAIYHAAEASDSLIQQRRHKLVISMPESPIWMDADFSRLSQIFSNLLNNAAKYTDNGGVIELKTKNTGSQVVISVKDNGIGIPKDMLQSIFAMFSQVDSSLERSQGGLGIGLTLVKNLVEMHGGTIQVLSHGSGKGSEFVVTLPVSARQEKPADKVILPEEESLLENPLKVLIVDDNKALADVMDMTIKLLGHHTRIAYDGASAIKLAREYQPEMVLMDIGLPGMNGYEVCKLMKHELPAHTLFVALTGWGQAEHRKRSEEAGFGHHLVKPARMEDLQQILNNYNRQITAPAAITDNNIINPLYIRESPGTGA